jgi:hypothetical protein
MNISTNKFGTVLTSRQSGKEAWSAYLPTLASVAAEEKVIVDFVGVNTLSPSWGDEFLTPLVARFADRVEVAPTSNPSVLLTLETLEKVNGYRIRRS